MKHPSVPACLQHRSRPTRPTPAPARSSPSRPARLALPLVLALALTACGSTPVVRYHTLVAPAHDPAASSAVPAPFVIEVLPVGIPAQVDQTQLVVREGASGMVLLESERWAAPLGDEFRAALSADLSRRLATQDIAGLARPADKAIFQIRVQVRRFDAWLSRQVQLDADWSLANPTAADSARLTCQGRFEQSAAGGYPELVRAGQLALAALATRIAADVQARAEQRDAGCSGPDAANRRPPAPKP